MTDKTESALAEQLLLVRRERVVARDTDREFRESCTVGERLSEQIAAFGGSWTFILGFNAFLAMWALVNTALLGRRRDAFDPYPYIFLNLLLSITAALQAPLIMMSQNRAAQRDRIEAKSDAS